MPSPRLLYALAAVIAAVALAAMVPRLGAAQAGGARSSTVRKVYPSAVRVEMAAAGEVVRSAAGIAFAREDGRTYVLTNAHVVEPSRTWRQPVALRILVSGERQPRQGKVVARGRVPDTDLAVVEISGADVPVTPLARDDSLALGEDLIVIGAPFGKGLSVAAGIVSQVKYERGESAAAPRVPRALKTDAAIGYGSSGGGVFDVPGGRLVGLVEGYRTARVAFGKDEGYSFDVPMPGETFAVPAARIRRFLVERGLGRLAPGTATAATRVRPGAAQGAVSPASGM